MLVRVRGKGAYIRTHAGMARPIWFSAGTIVHWGLEEPPREGKGFHVLTEREAATSEADPRSLSPEEKNREQEVVIQRRMETARSGDTIVEAMDQREIKVLKAVESLDPLNDNHWTADGLPMVNAVMDASGLENVSRDDIKTFAPEATRP
jgi:hypothetical protein